MENQQIQISGLETEIYNPFSASAEELLAAALDEAGLLQDSTHINGKRAEEYLRSYFTKRSQYQEITRLGCLLVKQGILKETDLHQALRLQKQRENMKLGEALVELGICSVEDIERSLDTQVHIRDQIQDLEEFRKKIESIKERLRLFF